MSVRKQLGPVDRHVAARLREARQLAHVSQECAGAYLGHSHQQIQKYEKAGSRISAGKLGILAHVYGQPVGFFFEGAPIKPAPALTCDECPAPIDELHDVESFVVDAGGLLQAVRCDRCRTRLGQDDHHARG